MPAPRNPEKAILALQNHLHKARNQIRNQARQDASLLLPIFKQLDAELQQLKIHFLHVNQWEDTLTSRFTSIERRVFSLFSDAKDNATSTSTSVKDIQQLHEKLKHLNQDIQNTLMLPPGSDTISFESRQSITREEEEEEVPSRKFPEEWWELRLEENIYNCSAMLNLQACYDDLERLDLRLCFLSFSIFPENAVMKKRTLIYWWIGEGFITGDGEKTAEVVGENVFRELLERGLLKPDPDEPKKPHAIVNACTIHPWIRHMLISLAKRADLFDFDWRGTPLYVTSTSSSMSRRACLVFGNQSSWSDNQGTTSSSDNNLLTVFNVSKRYLAFRFDWPTNLGKVEVLHLGRWQNSPQHHIEVLNEEFLKGFGDQKRLKYLSLRGISRITALPPSVVELFNLEILDLKACHNLETLPPYIGSMKKLTHLDVSDCPLLDSMPKGIERLTSLQVLKGFMIGNAKQTPCTISDLSKLKKLWRLSINIANEAVLQEGQFNHLKDMGSLRRLTISWGVKSRKREQIAAMKDLSFPLNLEKLDLRGIPCLNEDVLNLIRSLKDLTRLYIWGGDLRNSVSVSSVEILRLKYLKDFEIESKEKLLEAFPHLIYAEVKCGRIQEEWPNKHKIRYKHDFVLTKREIERSRTKEKQMSKKEDNVNSTESDKYEGEKADDKVGPSSKSEIEEVKEHELTKSKE